MSDTGEVLRKLPGIDTLLLDEQVKKLVSQSNHDLVVNLLRESIADFRQAILKGKRRGVTTRRIIADLNKRWHRVFDSSLRQVFNCTGVILHTGLGRAPVPQEALDAIHEYVGGYTNLEYDLETGSRGERLSHVEELLCRLTGAEAAAVVNNNAAAVYLALNTMSNRKEAIVSRGQLVEIGGRFRVPDIMARSGARMVEVGTTNKTHLSDFAEAITPRTGIFLRVHTSNFRQIGFVLQPELDELVNLAHANDVLVLDDLGSGAFFDLGQYGFTPEPLVTDSVKAGADIVTFSGDKLLGGSQAGILVGNRDLMRKIRRSPLMRVLRVDKFTLAILEATLRHYLAGGEALSGIPVVRMLTEAPDKVRRRCEKLQSLLTGWTSEVVSTVSRCGSGALPEEPIPSFALRITHPARKPARLARELRLGNPAVVGYLQNDYVYLDLKTVQSEELPALAETLNSYQQTIK